MAVTEMKASAFLNSLGVNTALDYLDTQYADVNMVANDLSYLNVTHVRDHIPGNPDVYARYAQIANQGVKFDLQLPGGNVDLGSVMQNLDAFAKAVPNSIAAVEGSNEINLWPVTFNGQTGLAAGTAEQSALYSAIHGDPLLSNASVYALSLGGAGADQESQLGNLAGSADFGNAHIYPGSGANTAQYLATWRASQSIPTGGDPMVVTEMGWFTEPDNPNGNGVSEDVQGKLTLNALLDNAAAGVNTTYLYELLDSKVSSQINEQDHYGLFHSDGTPKIAATDIHNLTTILADNTAGTGAATTPLNYTIQGLPSTGHSLVLDKSDGTHELTVWNEPALWDQNTKTEIAVPATPVTVQLGQVATGYHSERCQRRRLYNGFATNHHSERCQQRRLHNGHATNCHPRRRGRSGAIRQRHDGSFRPPFQSPIQRAPWRPGSHPE